jgi:Rrf2 family cysteine metabolism transcriptional repressor
MKLSTRTRYGTRAMLDLALNYENGVVSVKEIATRQQVSRKYLEHLLTSLRSAGLVRTLRGAQGGHTLARRPSQINLRDIHDVFEGTEGFVECTTRLEICDTTDGCVTREIWAEIHAACMEILESTTLEDLARRARNKRAA